MDELKIKQLENGIAVVSIDDQERTVNTLTPDLLLEFAEKIVPLLENPAVRAMVFISAKKNTFIAGADIKLFSLIDDPNLVIRVDRAYSRLFSRFYNCPKPLVAAIHGAALGGGLELALSCGFILATDHPKTVFGLPEVKLGILPAAGGTQRLPDRVGLFRGLEMMLTGRHIRARKALGMDLVDEVTPHESLLDRAIEIALVLSHKNKKHRKKKRSFMESIVSLPPARKFVFNKLRKKVILKTRGNYPGPLKIIDCVETGIKNGTKAALKQEIKDIGELFATPQCRALVWLFLTSQGLKTQPDGFLPPDSIAVIGAGLMGSDIASTSLSLHPVVVQDNLKEALERSEDRIKTGLKKQVRSQAITEDEQKKRLASFKTTMDKNDIADSDFIIEAVYEDLELKQRVLAEMEKIISPEAVFASCTSALPISKIAEKALHPERVIGMHYFSPAHKMPLLELVAHKSVSEQTVNKARSLAAAQGKSVIQVKDEPGFYTTRIFALYLNEALLLLAEGARIDIIDKTMKDFGYPIGPAALMDEVGLDVIARVANDLGKSFSDRWKLSHVTSRMLGAGCLGRKSQRGFYKYTEARKKKKRINHNIYSFFSDTALRPPAVSQIKNRLVLAMVNEAALCLQEGVISSPDDGDIGAVLGLGFPPFIGGPFHYIDSKGADVILSRLDHLADDDKPHFQPAQIIKNMAKSGKRFFK